MTTRSGSTYQPPAGSPLQLDRGQLRSGAMFRRKKIFYTSLIDLKRAARAIFNPTPQVFPQDVGILYAKERMVLYTCRFPITTRPADVETKLRQTLNHIFGMYDAVKAEISITANLVLQHRERGTFSIFWGQDFTMPTTTNRVELSTVYELQTSADLQQVPVDFATLDIVGAAQPDFADSAVRVHSVANVVYIIKCLVPADVIPPTSHREIRFDE